MALIKLGLTLNSNKSSSCPPPSVTAESVCSLRAIQSVRCSTHLAPTLHPSAGSQTVPAGVRVHTLLGFDWAIHPQGVEISRRLD